MSVEPTRDDTGVVGLRVVAQIIDLVVMFVGFLVLMFVFGFSGGFLGAVAGGGESVVEAFTGIGVLFGILASLGYNFLFEALWGGRTIGKRIVGIRVVNEDGSPLGPGAAFVRNIPTIVSLSWLAYLVALLSMAASDRRQRLFDLLAGTVVVDDGYEYGAASEVDESTGSAPADA